MADEWHQLTGEAAAVEYCKSEIAFYKSVFDQNHRRWMIWQRIAIVSGVIGTILVTLDLDFLSKPWEGIVKAVPVALASIATGLMGSFSFQADAVRQGATSDSLEGELAKFLARASPYDSAENGERVSFFMNSIRTIISNEQGNWKTQSSQSVLPSPGSPPST